MKEPAHLADDNVLRQDSQFLADPLGGLLRMKKWFNIKAAVDCFEFFRRGDSGSDVFGRHVVRDTDEAIRPARREPLQSDIGAIRQDRLSIMKEAP
jgi:hypothetical protein